MAIGDTITQAIPSVGTLGTGYATSINAFLTEVKTRLESKVAFSSLLASGTLDLLGQPLVNAKYVGFAQQSITPAGAPTGRYEYYNGEFYAVTAAGVVQITAGGALNVASAGIIGGDYGGANPASVRFSDADERYDFYDDFGLGEWGYVRALGFDVAAGVTSSFRARLAFGGVSSFTVTLPSTLPGAPNRALVTLDDAGQLTHNGASAKVTSDAYFDANLQLSLSRYIGIVGTGSKNTFIDGNSVQLGNGANSTTLDPDTGVTFNGGDIHHSTVKRYAVLAQRYWELTGTVGSNTVAPFGVILTSGDRISVPICLKKGDRVVSAVVNAAMSSGTGTLRVQAWVCKPDGTATSIGSVVSSSITT
jgi:hypothetical protein